MTKAQQREEQDLTLLCCVQSQYLESQDRTGPLFRPRSLLYSLRLVPHCQANLTSTLVPD